MTSTSNIIALNNISEPVKRVLFMGYGKNKTRLIDTLIDSNCEVHHTEAPITHKLEYDLIVCFGYTWRIPERVIHNIGCPILNLHIAYLPFNKGCHPNFWSFYENTPSGVTIYLVDKGMDTGPILYQKYVNFDETEVTFFQTYQRLINEIESLFINKLDEILHNKWKSKPQRGKGSFHLKKDLPKEFNGWDSIIEDEILSLDKILSRIKDKLSNIEGKDI